MPYSADLYKAIKVPIYVSTKLIFNILMQLIKNNQQKTHAIK